MGLRRWFAIPAVGLMMAVSGLTSGGSFEARADETPVITVRPERMVTSDGRPVQPIPAELIGGNHRWPDDGKGMWDPATNTPVGDIDDYARQIHFKTVRYPGGTVANMFDFTKAIGPQSERECQTSGGFANGLFEPTDSRYGPDENEMFVDLFDGQTMIMVPTIGRDAEDAANYVEYMNSDADGDAGNPNGGVDWGDVRAANGHPEPYAISVWEFSNEPYLPNQRYWRSPDPAVKVRQFIEGGWQRQTADADPYADNDGLFSGCDLATRQAGDGEPSQTYRVRFAPIAMPGDELGASGVGDGPIRAPVLRVDGEEWRLVENLQQAGPDAKVYAITKQAGLVRFGNGKHGAIPRAGAHLSIEYTSGVHEGYEAFRDAMKAVDPTIKVCAAWGKKEFIDAMGSRPYDCLGVHSYTTPPDDGTPIRYHNLQDAAGNKSADLAAFRKQLAGYFPDPDDRPEIMVTEYGTLQVGIRNYGATLGYALYVADLVTGQVENDVRLGAMSNVNAPAPASEDRRTYGSVFGSAPKFLITGKARMFEMYSAMVGGTPLTSSVANNPELTAQTGTYDGLRVLAACTDGVDQVMVINRDPDRQVTARVDLADAAGARDVRVATMNAPEVTSFNTDTHRDVIRIDRTTAEVAAPSLTHAFEPHSLTLLEFDGGADRTCGAR